MEDRLLMLHPIEIALGIVLLICAVFLVVAVLLQQGKEKGLSGTIGGGSDTFFGKTKGKTADKMLAKVTTIIAIVFVVVVIVAFVCDGMWDAEPATTTAAVTTAAPATTTEATVETTVAETTGVEVTGDVTTDVTEAPVVTTEPAPAE